MMKRFSLFEFEDQSWLPVAFRNAITQNLQFTLDHYQIYDPIFAKIEELIQITGSPQIVDLCSGSSGPWRRWAKKAPPPVKVLLTDKYPNPLQWKEITSNSQGKIAYSGTPVDALAIPNELRGLRIIFTAFHHFKPAEAKQLLKEIVAQAEPIAIFEFTERSFPAVIRAFFVLFLLPFFQTPFIHPRTLARFFWTYLIPVIPLMHWWDGLVSHLRTYTSGELQDMVNGIKEPEYHWEIGTERFSIHGLPWKITYLTGYPKSLVPPG